MITYSNKLDMTPGGFPCVINLNQYDDDVELQFLLHTRTGLFTLQTGTTAMIRGTKRDGNAYSADATINVSSSTVTVAVTKQMTAAAGKNVFELVLLKGTKVLSTANFILQVEHAAMDADTVTSESVLKEMNALIESASTAKAAAEEATEAAQSVSASAAQIEANRQAIAENASGIAANTTAVADLKDDFVQPGVVDKYVKNVKIYGAPTYVMISNLRNAFTSGTGFMIYLTDSQGEDTSNVLVNESELPVSGHYYKELSDGRMYSFDYDLSGITPGTRITSKGLAHLIKGRCFFEGLNDIVNKNQGSENVGKALVVGADGEVTLGEAGLPEAVKVALLNCFNSVGWKDGNATGDELYTELEDALYGLNRLVRISATFNQGSDIIYTTDDVDVLSNYLTVIGTYSDETTRELHNYVIDSEMTAGTCPCTVSYSGKTASFNAEITAKVYAIADSDIVQGGVASAYPYHNSNTNRVGYYGLGLPLKPGAKYKVEYTDNTSGGTVDVGIKRYLSAAHDAVVAHTNINFEAWEQAVSGWKKSGTEFMAEADQTMLFCTFRNSDSTGIITPNNVSNLKLTCIAGNVGV